MSSFDQVIARAVADRVLPGVVLLAENLNGSRYEKVLGDASLAPDAGPLGLDAVFTLMSLSKLVTVVLVLRAAERGLVDLDADVGPLLPELAAQKVLGTQDGQDGQDGGQLLLLVPRAAPITLRLLLTHSSGVGYDFLSPELRRWAAHSRGGSGGTGAAAAERPVPVERRFDAPLLFQPGAGWAYGAGLDWAGRLLERTTGSSLEQLVIRDVLTPLGLPAGALTYFPHRYPETVLPRLVRSLPVRRKTGSAGASAGASAGTATALATTALVERPSPFVANAEADAEADPEGRTEGTACGGSGLFGDAPSFMRVLSSLLHDDGRLLQPGSETQRYLFEPQLGSAAAREALLCNTRPPQSAWMVGDVPPTEAYDWSLGGLLVTRPSAHPWRRPGALLWSGAVNLTWIVDRDAGVCALFAANFLPSADEQGRQLMRAFEEHVYAELGRKEPPEGGNL